MKLSRLEFSASDKAGPKPVHLFKMRILQKEFRVFLVLSPTGYVRAAFVLEMAKHQWQDTKSDSMSPSAKCMCTCDVLAMPYAPVCGVNLSRKPSRPVCLLCSFTGDCLFGVHDVSFLFANSPRVRSQIFTGWGGERVLLWLISFYEEKNGRQNSASHKWNHDSLR